MSLEVLVFLVAVAVAFDFMNGFYDAANSIATIVSTGAMSPQAAVVWAAPVVMGGSGRAWALGHGADPDAAQGVRGSTSKPIPRRLMPRSRAVPLGW